MRDAQHFDQGYFGGIKHLGFRVTGRESPERAVKADDFELLVAARDCARELDRNGWVDVRLCAVQQQEYFNGVDEVEIDWRRRDAA